MFISAVCVYCWSNHDGLRSKVSLIIIIVIVITIIIIIISGASARASRNWKPVDARKFAGYDVAPNTSGVFTYTLGLCE